MSSEREASKQDGDEPWPRVFLDWGGARWMNLDLDALKGEQADALRAFLKHGPPKTCEFRNYQYTIKRINHE